MAKTHKMIVLAKAADNRVDELQAWYRERHIADLLKIPAFIAAEFSPVKVLERRAAPKQPGRAQGWDFVTIYTIAGDDPMEAVAEAFRRFGTDAMPRSGALASTSTISVMAVGQEQR